MSNNRFDQPAAPTAEVESRLTRAGRVPVIESRAAEIVAARVLHDSYRFSPLLGWFRWDGQRWASTDTTEFQLTDAVRQFCDGQERDYRIQAAEAEAELAEVKEAIEKRATETGDGSPRTSVDDHDPLLKRLEHVEAKAKDTKMQADFWSTLLGKGKIANLIGLCQSMAGVLTGLAEWDSRPDLFNCTNGTVDLRTGQLHGHDPAQLITKVAGGAYRPNARSETWDKVLEAVHPECLRWLQVRIGQAAIARPPDDDAAIVNDGGGENGKSTFMEAVVRGFGEYADFISHRTLLSDENAHPTEKMDLRGLRLAVLEETPEDGRLNPQQLKQIVGTKVIRARLMHQDSAGFVATHSLIINTNHLPQIDAVDHGTWRRLKRKPWPFLFVKPGQPIEAPAQRPGDGQIRRKVNEDDDLPDAVISWVVAGALAYYQEHGGVMPSDPEPVAEATADWQFRANVAVQFVTDYIVADPNGYIDNAEMADGVREFLRQKDKAPWSDALRRERLLSAFAKLEIELIADTSKATKIWRGARRTYLPAELDLRSLAPLSPLSRPAREADPQGTVKRVWRGIRWRTPTDAIEERHLHVVKDDLAV